jgi:hypothetical protein
MVRHQATTKVHDQSISSPTRDDFVTMLEESFITQSPQEGNVIKGTVVAIENDFAIVDVGLKTEGRVSLKEFSMPGVPVTVKVGDEVEVYLERVENALGEAVLSRDKARREESWVRLERAFNEQTRVTGVIFGRVKGGFTVDLDGAVAFLPGSQVDVRPMRDVGPLMNQPQPFQILKMDRRRGPCWKSAAPRSAPRWSPLCRKSRWWKASSRTSRTTAPSSISAASTASCTSPISPGGASAIRRKFSASARPSTCRSSRSTTRPSASASA